MGSECVESASYLRVDVIVCSFCMHIKSTSHIIVQCLERMNSACLICCCCCYSKRRTLLLLLLPVHFVRVFCLASICVGKWFFVSSSDFFGLLKFTTKYCGQPILTGRTREENANCVSNQMGRIRFGFFLCSLPCCIRNEFHTFVLY